MAKRALWESIRVKGDQVVATVKQVIHEGNVRRIVVKQGGRVLAEFPVTVGVVGAVLAPMLAALGALAALLTECTILVERVEDGHKPRRSRKPPGGVKARS